MKRLTWAFCAICACDGGSARDAGPDVGSDASMDAAFDAAMDAAMDAAFDATVMDAAIDATNDHDAGSDEDSGFVCIDRDGDGHLWDACGGDDCDDSEARTHPGADPDCLGAFAFDADCNDVVDTTQAECGRTSPSCDDALPLELGVERTFLTSTEGDCIDDDAEFFRFELDENSDLRVTVAVLYDSEADPEVIPMHYYSAFLRDDCGSSESRFPGQACSHFSPSNLLYPGSASRTYDAAFVGPGSYVLEIRGAVFSSTSVLGMAVTVEATPALDPVCTGPVLTTTATGTTDGPDAFRFTCEHFLRGPPVFVDASERIHRVIVSERERWRITARSDSGPVRIALHSECDPGLQPMSCLEATPACGIRTLDALLDPGEYYLRVEGRFGGEHDYDLQVRREAPGASCTGAPVITTSGIVSGDTTGATDDFRGSETCSDATGPDDVWRIDVTSAGYFAADLVLDESFANAHLALRDECGGEPIRQHNTGVSWTVEPGTYYLTVDGYEPTDFGAYQVDITMP